MGSNALTRRTGRIIATGRAVLALLFLLGVWLDPTIPPHREVYSFLLVSCYLLWTALLMIVSWRSWWFDFRLGLLAQSIDFGVLLVAIGFAEHHSIAFQGPFPAFAAFLLVVATTRWGWRATAATALVLTLANLAIVSTLSGLDTDADLFRLFRTTAQMIIMSSLMIWMSISLRGERMVRFAEPPGLPGERMDLVLNAGLKQIAAELGARQVVMAFATNEEPWVEFRHYSRSGTSARRAGPAEFGDQLNVAMPPALFNFGKGRLIALENARPKALKTPVTCRLARIYGIDGGIFVPLQTATGSGHIIAWDCEMLSVDDLATLRALADQIGHALDREEAASLARNVAESGVRNAVARDLHDSVAQFLAGALFRLEALRRWISEGHDPYSEIDSIKNALRLEQGHLRKLIERLRRGEEGDRRTEIADELRGLLHEAGAHWQIETELVLPEQSQWVSIQLSHEIRQLVREGIANAVRHGKCRKVCVTLSDDDGFLKLSISDDGIGFPDMPVAIRPRSISERVEALGGQFRIDSTTKGARLDIAIRTGVFA